MARSATQLYCPHCKAIRSCNVADYHDAKDFAGEPGQQRWYRKDHPDINWFRRVRQCSTCSELFTTVELDEQLLLELVRLRERVGELRSKIDTHNIAAKAASDALNQLSAAIGRFDLPEPPKVAEPASE